MTDISVDVKVDRIYRESWLMRRLWLREASCVSLNLNKDEYFLTFSDSRPYIKFRYKHVFVVVDF